MKRICSLFLVMTLCFSLLTIAQAAELTDVSEDASYADAAAWAVDQDLITTDENGAFKPNDIFTRGQVIELLWHMAGSPVPNQENRFLDVTPSMSCFKGVLWADEKDITAGYSENTFGTEDPCTHAQVITFLWRTAGMPAAPQPDGFADLAGAYYANALAWAEHTALLESDIVSFVPSAPVSRAELAQYLYLMSLPQISEEDPLSAPGQLVISQQPVSMEPSGGMVTFKVQASGGKPPYTHNWESKTGSGSWFRVYDTTSNTLTKFPAASMISSGLYFRCVVADAAGSKVTSDEVKVLAPDESFTPSSGSSTSAGGNTSASEPLTVTKQPTDTAAKGGAIFKVEVSGGKAPYSYKWESKVGSGSWSRIYDSISNTLTKHPSQSMIDSGLYFRCVISDAEGHQVVTDAARVLPTGQSGSGSALPSSGTLTITRQPENIPASYQPGGYVTFSVAVSGGKAPYSYQWKSTSVYLKDGTFNILSQENAPWDNSSSYATAELRIPFDQECLEYNKQYCCEITDSNGHSVTSQVAGFESAYRGPFILDHPWDNHVDGSNSEEKVSFRVDVNGGTKPYRYQWQYIHDEISEYRDLTAADTWVSGWNEPTLVTTAGSPFPNTRFRCIVTDAQGTVATSQSAQTLID